MDDLDEKFKTVRDLNGMHTDELYPEDRARRDAALDAIEAEVKSHESAIRLLVADGKLAQTSHAAAIEVWKTQHAAVQKERDEARAERDALRRDMAISVPEYLHQGGTVEPGTPEGRELLDRVAKVKDERDALRERLETKVEMLGNSADEKEMYRTRIETMTRENQALRERLERARNLLLKFYSAGYIDEVLSDPAPEPKCPSCPGGEGQPHKLSCAERGAYVALPATKGADGILRVDLPAPEPKDWARCEPSPNGAHLFSGGACEHCGFRLTAPEPRETAAQVAARLGFTPPTPEQQDANLRHNTDPEPQGEPGICAAESLNDYECSLPKGHAGEHVASDGVMVCDRWPNPKGEDAIARARAETWEAAIDALRPDYPDAVRALLRARAKESK